VGATAAAARKQARLIAPVIAMMGYFLFFGSMLTSVMLLLSPAWKVRRRSALDRLYSAQCLQEEAAWAPHAQRQLLVIRIKLGVGRCVEHGAAASTWVLL
jgi:hypothetical protein